MPAMGDLWLHIHCSNFKNRTSVMIYTVEIERLQSTFNAIRFRKQDTLLNKGQNPRHEIQFSRKNLVLLKDLNCQVTDAVTCLQWAQYLSEGLPVIRIII
jgi:hypothetical protein